MTQTDKATAVVQHDFDALERRALRALRKISGRIEGLMVGSGVAIGTDALTRARAANRLARNAIAALS